MKERWIREGEGGSVLVIAMVMLVMLSLLGISATTTSTIEMRIADNERTYQRTFYVADAGIEHVRSMLTSKLIEHNASKISTGSPLEWDFALDGSSTFCMLEVSPVLAQQRLLCYVTVTWSST